MLNLHDVVLALDPCTEVTLIIKATGRISFEGSADELLDHYSGLDHRKVVNIEPNGDAIRLQIK